MVGIRTSHDQLFRSLPDLSEAVEAISAHPVARGGYSDILRGTFNDVDTKRDVAIKVIRVATRQEADIERLKTRISREVTTWNMVKHKNIIPFYGLCWQLPTGLGDGLPAMVYPYCAGGTCKQYLQRNPGADRMEIIRQLAGGLTYLHSLPEQVVHGDIKAANVLMQDDGTPLLADFGLSRIVAEISTGLTTSSCRGSYRWMAPELFGGVEDLIQVVITAASDVWAFGCLCFEILTDTLPWTHIKSDTALVRVVGLRPPLQPIHESSIIGHILKHCWMHEPSDRPMMCDMEIALREGNTSQLDQPHCVLKRIVQFGSPASGWNDDWNTFTSIFSGDPLFTSPSESLTPALSTLRPDSTGVTPYMLTLALMPNDSTSPGPDQWSKTDREGEQLRFLTPWQRGGTSTPSSAYTCPSSRMSSQHSTPAWAQPYPDQFAQSAPGSPLFGLTEGYSWGHPMASSLQPPLFAPNLEPGFSLEQRTVDPSIPPSPSPSYNSDFGYSPPLPAPRPRMWRPTVLTPQDFRLPKPTTIRITTPNGTPVSWPPPAKARSFS